MLCRQSSPHKFAASDLVRVDTGSADLSADGVALSAKLHSGASDLLLVSGGGLALI